MKSPVEWHQTRLVLTFRWVLAFTLIAPPIGGCWLLVTIIFAPAVYILAPIAAIAGLIYITIILALEKRKINTQLKRIIIAAAIGFTFALPFMLIGESKLIRAVFMLCIGAMTGTVMIIENSPRVRQIVGLPQESADIYKIDPHYQ
jgi:hypothetical protein